MDFSSALASEGSSCWSPCGQVILTNFACHQVSVNFCQKRNDHDNSFEEIIAQGANKVIENLLENIDDIKDIEEEMIQDVTLEEVADLSSPKKYYNECTSVQMCPMYIMFHP